jgi:hypothetical protein
MSGWGEEVWLQFLAFCHKYEVALGWKEAVETLAKSFSLRAAHRLMLSHRFNIEQWREESTRQLLTLPNGQWEAQDIQNLGPELTSTLLQIRSKILDHNLWMQCQTLSVQHAVGCSLDRCGRNWDEHYRATVLWLIHPNHSCRLTGEAVRDLFRNLEVPYMRPQCRQETLITAVQSIAFSKEEVIISEGVLTVAEMLKSM